MKKLFARRGLVLISLTAINIAACIGPLKDLNHAPESAAIEGALYLQAPDRTDWQAQTGGEVWNSDPTAYCEVEHTETEIRFNNSYRLVISGDEETPFALAVSISENEDGIWEREVGLTTHDSDKWQPNAECEITLLAKSPEGRHFRVKIDCPFVDDQQRQAHLDADIKASRCFDPSAISAHRAAGIVKDVATLSVDLGQALVDDPKRVCVSVGAHHLASTG